MTTEEEMFINSTTFSIILIKIVHASKRYSLIYLGLSEVPQLLLILLSSARIQNFKMSQLQLQYGINLPFLPR